MLNYSGSVVAEKIYQTRKTINLSGRLVRVIFNTIQGYQILGAHPKETIRSSEDSFLKLGIYASIPDFKG
jgi:hypothetical protein